MKIIILFFVLLFISVNVNALEVVLKVGSQYPSDLNSKHGTGWRDGEIVDIRESGFYKGFYARKHFCVIDFPNIDYWALRGNTDPYSNANSVMNLKKFLSRADSTGNYKWENGYDEKALVSSARDRFIDFQDLLDLGIINKAQYDSIYDKEKNHLPISIPDISILGKLKFTKTDVRKNEK